MLVKHQVIDDAFRETNIRLVAVTGLRRARLNGAFRHGLAAGDRVNLNRPVGAYRQYLAAVTDGRDHQRSKVYDWEERFVAPYDTTLITFAQAQGMVNAIWAEMGLRFPPKVECLPRQACATIGRCRSAIDPARGGLPVVAAVA